MANETFDDIIHGAFDPARPETRTIHAPAHWGQGRAIYGGIQAAAALHAMRPLVGVERIPRALVANFLGPLAPEPATVSVTVLRSGRATTHVRTQFEQNGKIRSTFHGVFGADRTSSLTINAANAPERAGPDGIQQMPYLEGLTPSFTQHFHYRWTDGALPYTGGTEPRLAGWCRHNGVATEGYTAALGLMDAWPSPLVTMLSRPAPASTVTWTMYFHNIPDQTPDGWWWYASEISNADAGYGTLKSDLYLPDGRLAAHATQLVAVFG